MWPCARWMTPPHAAHTRRVITFTFFIKCVFIRVAMNIFFYCCEQDELMWHAVSGGRSFPPKHKQNKSLQPAASITMIINITLVFTPTRVFVNGLKTQNKILKILQIELCLSLYLMVKRFQAVIFFIHTTLAKNYENLGADFIRTLGHLELCRL